MKRVDYASLPEVVAMRKRHEELLDPNNPEMTDETREQYEKASKILRFPVGTELLLRVKVTDSVLFKEAAGSVYSEESVLSIPGADLLEINWDLRHRATLIDYMKEQVRRLEEESGKYDACVSEEPDNGRPIVIVRETGKCKQISIEVPLDEVNPGDIDTTHYIAVKPPEPSQG